MRGVIYYSISKFLIIVICISMFTSCSKTDVAKTTPPPITVNPPSITSITPLKALATSQISIYGSNFSKIIADNKVIVNGIAATVDSASTTEVVFTLPANSTSGTIKLTSGNTTLTYSNTFSVISPDLLSTFTTSGGSDFEHVAIDVNGNAYGDGDDSNGGVLYTVSKATPSGVISNFATIPDTTAYLYGTAVDKAGNVYETNKGGNNCIYKITPTGTISILAGGTAKGHSDGQGSAAKFSALCGLAIDAQGNLYTSDNHYIRKITPGGLVSTIAGTGADGHADGSALSATFGATEGIAVDTKGNVYVGDNKYFNIRKISPGGIVSTLAGNGTAGIVDGKGSAAEFYYPQGMAVDAAGNVFVSDSSSLDYCTIRMITQDGVVTTFLKTVEGVPNPQDGGQAPYASASLAYSDGLGFDASGNLYICSTEITAILKLDFK